MFKHELLDNVSIKVSGEIGIVVGRSDSATSVDQYLLQYKCADGRAVEAWWNESALSDQLAD